jgi:hypothetical protein
MPNMIYSNPEDEELDDEEGSQTPYDSVSDRAALETPDPSAPPPPSQLSIGSSPPPPPDMGKPDISMMVKNAIAQKSGLSLPNSTPKNPSIESDPMMQQYLKNKSELDDAQLAKIESDRITNLGQSFSQLAQGTNAPKDNPVFKSIQGQNTELLGSKEKDQDLRRKVMDAIEARNSRESIAKDNRLSRQTIVDSLNKDRALKRDELSSHKVDQQVNKWANALKDDLDPNKARGGNMSFNQKKVDQAERLEGLIKDSSGNISNLDSRQVEELAIGLNSMLSNSSSSAVSQVEALVPKTALGNASKLKEWLTNNPTGMNQMAFVKRMADTVTREKTIASNQIKKAQKQRLSAYSKFKDADPDQYNQILNAYGLNENPDDAEPKNQDMTPPKTGYQAGSLVKVRGKMYRVGSDGDSLEEVM